MPLLPASCVVSLCVYFSMHIPHSCVCIYMKNKWKISSIYGTVHICIWANEKLKLMCRLKKWRKKKNCMCLFASLVEFQYLARSRKLGIWWWKGFFSRAHSAGMGFPTDESGIPVFVQRNHSESLNMLRQVKNASLTALSKFSSACSSWSAHSFHFFS